MNRILELWSGTSSGTRPWADRGYEIVTVTTTRSITRQYAKTFLM